MKKFFIIFFFVGVVAMISSAAFASSSDLSINVTVNPETALISDEIIYNCVVTNHGPDATTAMHGYISPDSGGTEDIYMTLDGDHDRPQP